MNRNIIFIHPLQEECDAFTRVCLENEYEVTAVSDGEEALALLRDQTFAIAVVSRRMKGEEVAHILTALEAHPETAIILGAAAISKSDLIYFFNRRKVYRIYLEPIDYRTEMLNILDAAMLDVEVKAANRQDANEGHPGGIYESLHPSADLCPRWNQEIRGELPRKK